MEWAWEEEASLRVVGEVVGQALLRLRRWDLLSLLEVGKSACDLQALIAVADPSVACQPLVVVGFRDLRRIDRYPPTHPKVQKLLEGPLVVRQTCANRSENANGAARAARRATMARKRSRGR